MKAKIILTEYFLWFLAVMSPFLPLRASANSGDADIFDLSLEQLLQIKVYSPSRMAQTIAQAPNAMTIIDRDMIVASGFRSITDLFKLVPGMYVSYYKGSQAIVAYHGATDASSRRMQVMIDGRSMYLPPANTVDWSNLPITIDDIERIEVIRGPAAASYGANSTQGVINIITKDASEVQGKTVKLTAGTKGIGDGSVYFGNRGDAFDYRMTLGYTSDHGYDNLTTPPNNLPPSRDVLNNSYNDNQARLVNFRGNYYPNTMDQVCLQFGFNNDVQGVGFSDHNPSPSNPNSTNGDPPHDLNANSGFMQLGWTRKLDKASEFNLTYFHVQENQREAFPVYLGGVYFPGPVVQSLATGRDQIQAQHTLSTSDSNRLVYGAVYQRNGVNGQSLMPPLSLYLASSSVAEDYQVFANDEWSITPRLMLNTGGMVEKADIEKPRLSPRISLNFQLTPLQTFRAGISVADRTPALLESNFPAIQPGALYIPSAMATSPNLMPERLVSHEIAYLTEFPEWRTFLDVRLFSDRLNNGIMPNTTSAVVFSNGFSAEYHGMEATLKKRWGESGFLTANFAHEVASSNGPTLAAGNPYLVSALPWNNDILSASIPKNSASLLYSQRFSGDYSFSTSYYYQEGSMPFGRQLIDYQPAQKRVDMRIARQFHFANGNKGEVALVAQNIFNTGYTEYIASNLFNRRGYLTMTVDW